MGKRVLIVNTIGLNREGITAVIYNYISHMNREGLTLEFIGSKATNPEILKQFQALGAVSILPNRKKEPRRFYPAFWRLLRQGFDVVHLHGNSGTMFLDVLCARLAGVRKIITHGHSSSSNHMGVHKLLRAPMSLLATDRLACGQQAGEFLYGKRSFSVLNNAIDLTRFRFSPETRSQVRSQLGIGQEFVIGHVGYFAEPKNQMFLVEAFHVLHQREPDTRLLLVGDGADREAVARRVRELGLEDAVLFAGRVSNPEVMYSAMDMLAIPSKWEGLSLALVEAQANGLPVLASDAVPQDANCLESNQFLSLDLGPEAWAEKIREIRSRSWERDRDTAQALRARGFDIREQAETLRKIYMSQEQGKL